MFDVRTANIVCLLDLYRSEKNLLKSGHIIINLKIKKKYVHQTWIERNRARYLTVISKGGRGEGRGERNSPDECSRTLVAHLGYMRQ